MFSTLPYSKKKLSPAPRDLHSSSFIDNSDVEESANLSTFFDVGGIIGGILAGVISDYSGMSASTCSVMLVAAIPMVSKPLLCFSRQTP